MAALGNHFLLVTATTCGLARGRGIMPGRASRGWPDGELRMPITVIAALRPSTRLAQIPNLSRWRLALPRSGQYSVAADNYLL